MRQKISCVFPVMNRNDRVEEAVPTWIECEEVGEIVIVDWSSKDPVSNLKITNHEKVRIVRVEDEQYFLSLSFSMNCGVLMSKYDNILKLDIDYKLTNKNLLKILHRNSGTKHFFCGTVPDPDHYCYWGLSYFNRNSFLKIGGFNENFIGWGGEDVDFYDRLEQIGVERTVILNIKDFVYHIPHDENLRVENHKFKDTKFSNDHNGNLSKQGNKFILSKYEKISDDGKTMSLKRILN